MPRTSAWLSDPEVQLPGPLGRKYTFITDGKTSRVIEHPQFGDPIRTGPAWPAAKSPERSPWQVPLMVQLAPGQTLVTDGVRSWPREKYNNAFVPPVPIEDAPVEEEEECVPTSVADIVADPAETPYNIDDEISFSVTFDFAPTPPITYEWKKDVNGVLTLIGTDATLAYIVADADITAKNVGGLGRITIIVIAYNCGSVIGSSRTENFAAQGTPP